MLNLTFAAHKNVKVFISHCGLLGSQEAMYHATPMVAMPIFGDQMKNSFRWQTVGIAKTVNWKDLSEKRLKEAIQEVLHDQKYVSKLFLVFQ